MSDGHGATARGSGTVEILVVLAVAGLLVAVAVPHLAEARARARLSAAGREVAGLLRKCRTEAISRGRSVAVNFDRQGDTYLLTMHEDSDGDGIRMSDIRSGEDRAVRGPWRIGDHAPGVTFSILPRERVRKVPPQTGYLSNLSDPIKFGPRDLVSCTALGGCSTGTAYLSDGNRSMAAVVLYGRSGRVRVWRWVDEDGVWVR